MDIIEALGKIGFTRHESVLYLTLCKEGELSGYEAAKISGISRSNAYLALAGLVEKGGAYRIDGDVIRHAAVPVAELSANHLRETQHVLAFIERNAPQRTEATNSFLTISGEVHVADKIRNIFGLAKERIYLSLARPELDLFLDDLARAVKRGLKVVVISESEVVLEGVTGYRRPGKAAGQIRLIADSAEVLTGEFRLNLTANCIYSKNLNLVQLIKDSLTNEIKLIEIERNGR